MRICYHPAQGFYLYPRNCHSTPIPAVSQSTGAVSLKNISLHQKGFTLIEIMVVVVILAILASVIAPRIMDNPDKARVSKAKHDINALESALDVYRLDNFVYPTTDQGLESLVTQPTITPEPPNWKQGGYIKRLQKDPWGNEYLYLNPGQNGEIDIYSLGADGAPGGDGINADIGNWDTE
jgi:general secretion pathway protein G